MWNVICWIIRTFVSHNVEWIMVYLLLNLQITITTQSPSFNILKAHQSKHLIINFPHTNSIVDGFLYFMTRSRRFWTTYSIVRANNTRQYCIPKRNTVYTDSNINQPVTLQSSVQQQTEQQQHSLRNETIPVVSYLIVYWLYKLMSIRCYIIM